MAYDSANKRLYVDVANGKGISLSEVASCLGDGRVNSRGQRDLGMLCTSKNINIWSPCKPFVVRGDNDHPRGVQSMEDRRNAGYGFYWQEHMDDWESPVARSATECFERAVDHEGKWQYNRPDKIFRLRDFDGYEGLSEKPYTCVSLSLNEEIEKRFAADTNLNNDNVRLRFSDMPELTAPYDGVLEDMEIVLLVKNVNSYDLSVVYSGIKVYELDREYGNIEATIKVEATTEDEPQHYEAVFAAYNGKGVNDNPIWIYLPGGYMTFSMTGYYRLSYDWYEEAFSATNVSNYPVTASTQSVKRISLWLDAFYSFSNYRPEGKYILHIWDKTAGYDNGVDVEFDLWNDGSRNISTGDLPTSLRVPASNLMVTMDIYFRDGNIPVSTSPDYTTMHFDFLADKTRLGAASQSDGVSVWDVLQYVNNNRP